MRHARSIAAAIFRGPRVAAAFLLVFAIAGPVPARPADAVGDSLAVGGIPGLAPSPYTWGLRRVPSGPVVDPEWALFHLQRVLWDPVDPHRLGSLTAGLQYRVNGEVYRFSSERTLRQFTKSPTRWCGLLRDPVTGRPFRPSARSPEAYWVGGPYFFESESTKTVFVEDPQRYEVIRGI